jgi:inhibitor of cysteine peptidase
MRILNLAKIILVAALCIGTQTYAISVPAVPATDVPVYTETKSAFTVTAAQPTFILNLKSNPTTGFSWFLRDYNANLIEAVKHEFAANPDKKLMGAPGYESWTFKVKPAAFKVPQQTIIRLVYARPWEPAETSTQQIFKVTTSTAK